MTSQLSLPFLFCIREILDLNPDPKVGCPQRSSGRGELNSNWHRIPKGEEFYFYDYLYCAVKRVLSS
jgi:hypothetical protein